MKTTKALAAVLIAGAALLGAAGSASAAPAGGDPMAGIALKASDASMAKAGPVAAGGGSHTKGLLVGPNF
ncbi:hypothetical protein GCM10009801_74000 [Streptomyces albiaxialis]|uniref:ATP-binding protein n=1 Tax=Streptomyces albiaxialis TaxID=329523 RepID=A0ABN2WYW0_9ACTN